MAGEQTHALIVAEGANTLTCAERSNRKLMLVLLALWALLVAAISPEGAVDALLAQDGCEHNQAVSLSDREDAALARGAARLGELRETAHEPAHYRVHHEAPPQCELGELEPEDAEEDGKLDALTLGFVAYFARFLPFGDQTLSRSATVWQAQFSLASALPRGPPRFSC